MGGDALGRAVVDVEDGIEGNSLEPTLPVTYSALTNMGFHRMRQRRPGDGVPRSHDKMGPRSESRTQAMLHWSVAAMIVLAYSLYYGQMVMRHPAVPYFDQTNYMYQIYHIHNVWKNASGVADYFQILGGAFPERPPLLMIPLALLWGDHARPQPVALLWLGIRLSVLSGQGHRDSDSTYCITAVVPARVPRRPKRLPRPMTSI